MRTFRILTAVMGLVVIAFLCRPAHAGRFANLVVITVTTADAVVDVPIDPVSMQVHPPLLKKLIPAKPRLVTSPVSVVAPKKSWAKQYDYWGRPFWVYGAAAPAAAPVCTGPNCPQTKVADSADCPCGADCACEPCECPTVAENPPAPTPAATEGPQHSIVHRGPVAAFIERGPVRKACRGVFSRVKNFIVNGGPIRQRLKARRGR